MSNELYSYLQQLHAYVQSQELRIQNLEQSIKKLEEETNKLKNRTPINVERIEYKFDQLKVETLDGTLNIGLNPSDLDNIEDFAINNSGLKTPFSEQDKMKRTIEIEDAIYQYLDNDLPEVIADVQESHNLTLDASHISFIKEDIKKQLPIRIDYYLNQFLAANRGEVAIENMEQEITQQLIKEIQKGVQIFISNFPENMKGMKKE